MPTQEEIDEAKNYLKDIEHTIYDRSTLRLGIMCDAYDEALLEIVRRQAWVDEAKMKLSEVERLLKMQEEQIGRITLQWEGAIRELEKAEKCIAELEALPKLDPHYIYERQLGAPDWMVPAIKCKVRDSGGLNVERLIVNYSQKLWHYHDIQGVAWQTAEPIEKAPKWMPQDDEPVAYYWTDSDNYKVMSYADFTRQNWSTAPIIVHYSGQRDMRIEALKDEPRYEP